VSAAHSIRPAGYAATAAGFLDEAAAGGDGRDLPVRQLGALQRIGYGLLTIADQLRDLADAVTGNGGELAGIASAVQDLYRAPLGDRVRGALAHLRRPRPGRLR